MQQDCVHDAQQLGTEFIVVHDTDKKIDTEDFQVFCSVNADQSDMLMYRSNCPRQEFSESYHQILLKT